MSDDPDSLTLRYLRRLDERTLRIETGMDDIRTDIRSLKTHMAGFLQNEIAQDSALAEMRDRLSRVERRLDLSEEAR